MEDAGAGDRPAVPLPPGFRFYPSEEQLFNAYLLMKNANPSAEDTCNLIKELDLYSYLPLDLPDTVCYPYGRGGRKRHWFCYTARAASGEGRTRRVEGGFWRRSGRVRDVTGGNEGNANVLLGTRTRFVFYLRNSAIAALRTDFIMYEYAPANHFEASFVLCRVFLKARRGNMPSNLMTSRAGASGSQVPGFPQELDMNNSIGYNNISTGPIAVGNEQNHRVAPDPVSEADPRFHVQSQPGELVRFPRLPNSAVTLQSLISLYEEDFIELDDLRPSSADESQLTSE